MTVHTSYLAVFIGLCVSCYDWLMATRNNCVFIIVAVHTFLRLPQPPVVPDFLQQRPDHPSSFSSPQQPGSSTVDPSALPVKEAVVTHLLSFLDAGLVEWCVTADLTAMCCNSHKQFLELKVPVLTIIL